MKVYIALWTYGEMTSEVLGVFYLKEDARKRVKIQNKIHKDNGYGSIQEHKIDDMEGVEMSYLFDEPNFDTDSEDEYTDEDYCKYCKQPDYKCKDCGECKCNSDCSCYHLND